MNTNHRRSFYFSWPTNSLTDILLQVKLHTQNLHTIRTITNRLPPVKLRIRLVCASSRLFSLPDTRSSIGLRARKMISVSYKGNYSRVSFCDCSVFDDSLLQPLSSRAKHSRLVVQYCRNSIVLSLLSALLALFRCACVSSFSILLQFF